jgi:hypothetical protein
MTTLKAEYDTSISGHAEEKSMGKIDWSSLDATAWTVEELLEPLVTKRMCTHAPEGGVGAVACAAKTDDVGSGTGGDDA